MARRHTRASALRACVVALSLCFSAKSPAQDDSETRRQILELQQQNKALQEQLRKQQELIDTLSRKVGDIQEADRRHSKEVEELQAEVKGTTEPVSKPGGFSLGNVTLSGEGGVGYFKSGSQGMFPKGDFRVDEARLFVESPIWKEVYFFGQLDLTTRESPGLTAQLGELYLDFENVSELWDRQRMLNIRAGRMFTPYGEEYQNRYAIDNPLISHSLSDLWGVDEGIELYGTIGKFSYAAAVQNGGASYRDFTSDKSVAGRLGYDPTPWLHLSVSGMRTGDLARGDMWSEMWFGGGWFVPFGSSNVTSFHANLVEGDVEFKLPLGHLKAFGGYIHYDDNDQPSNNRRDVYYYSIEGVHTLIGKLYATVRFSQILAPNGFPIVGNAAMGHYGFAAVTDELWRLSLGLGYQFSKNLVLKTEYSFERGTQVNGQKRDEEDFFGIEVAFKF
jgi:hypothetical protein